MTQTHVTHDAVHCRRCDRLVSVASRRSRFCPHCGRRLRPSRAAFPLIPMIVAGAVAASHWQRSHPPRPTFTVANAQAALVSGMLANGQTERTAELDDLHRRASVVKSARKALVAQADDLANVSARITTAVARANDEDRWPVKVAGRTLGHTDADALVAKVTDALATERRAIEHDADVLGRITAAESALQGELADIDRLRHLQPSADVKRQAEAYREPSPQLPDPADLTPDPIKPVDVAALLK